MLFAKFANHTKEIDNPRTATHFATRTKAHTATHRNHTSLFVELGDQPKLAIMNIATHCSSVQYTATHTATHTDRKFVCGVRRPRQNFRPQAVLLQ